MKVLHVIYSMETGGAQKLIRDLLPELDKAGAHSELLVFRETGSGFERDLKSAGVRTRVLGCGARSPLAALRLAPLMRGFDIVHAHLFPALYHLAAAGLICRKPLVYTEHSTSNRRRGMRWLRPAERLVYRRYESVVCVSGGVRDELARWIGEGGGRPRMETVPNGIRLGEYRGAEPAASPERFWGRKGTAVLMAARFCAAKDQATLIRAVPLIRDKGVFAAFAGDGETMRECAALAEASGAGGRCLFLGRRDDVPQLIANAAIGVLSSRYEGFGLSAVEVMAGGKPLVASDAPGLEIAKGRGLVFRTGDERGLADCINSLLEDEALYRRVSARCSAGADSYDIARTAAGYMGVYRRIMEEEGRTP